MGIIGLLIIGYLGYRFICWVFGPDPTLSPEEQKEVDNEIDKIMFIGECFRNEKDTSDYKIKHEDSYNEDADFDSDFYN